MNGMVCNRDYLSLLCAKLHTASQGFHLTDCHQVQVMLAESKFPLVSYVSNLPLSLRPYQRK